MKIALTPPGSPSNRDNPTRGYDAAQLLPLAQRMRTVLVRETSRGFVAECPSLMGCVTHGSTRAEAVRNIRQAIARYQRASRHLGLMPANCTRCAWVHRPAAARACLGWV